MPLVHGFSYGEHGVVRASVDRENLVLKDFIASELRGIGSTPYREVRTAVEAVLRGEEAQDDLTYDAFSVEVGDPSTTIEYLHIEGRKLTVRTTDFLAVLIAYGEFVATNPA